MEPLCYDAHGHPLYPGDRVRATRPKAWMSAGVGVMVSADDPRHKPHRTGKKYPAFVPDTDQTAAYLRSYRTEYYDGSDMEILRRAWICMGRPCWTFSRTNIKFPWLELIERKDPDMIAKDLTKTQEARFDSITDRIFAKVERTFGETIEASEQGEKEEAMFEGEDLSRTMTVVSRGVIYTVEITAKKQL